MTIDATILAKRWDSAKSAKQFVRRGGLDMDGYEVRSMGGGKYGIAAVEPEDENVPLSPTQIEVSGDGTVTVGSAIDQPATDAGEDAGQEADAGDDTAPAADAAPVEAKPMPAKVIFQIEEPWDGAVALNWAHTFAKRAKEKIIIRDAVTFEVIAEVGPHAGKEPKAARAPRPRAASNNAPGQRSQATAAIIEALRDPAGKTLEEIGQAAGWVNKPSKFHLERIGRKAGFRVEITTQNGRKHYRAVFTDTVVKAA